MQEYVNAICNIRRGSAKRCRQGLFEFWLRRADSPPFKITRGLGAFPQTKLTISVAEIRSIHRKWTSTCKSRDSRKSSKKQNQRIADLAFCLGRDCKTMTLKHNNCMKCGASNLLLGRKLLLSCLSTPCSARLVTSRRALCFKVSSSFARQLGNATLLS